MVAPRSLARFNRHVTNRVLGTVAPRLPGFGVILHTGRKSGRPYRTPVNIFRTGDGWVVALTYGPESDWVRNVLAGGGCDAVIRGRQVHLTAPALVRDPHGVPVALRPILAALGVHDFLRLSAAA